MIARLSAKLCQVSGIRYPNFHSEVRVYKAKSWRPGVGDGGH